MNRRTLFRIDKCKHKYGCFYNCIFYLFASAIIGCTSHDVTYKPGMGELMCNIQLHHAKLWFAGENGNWPLAAYNESLIRNAFKRIKLYHGDTYEAKVAYMIDPAMDSMTNAIGRKDQPAFESAFRFLTASCNNCHVVTKHAFNLIMIPLSPPIGNQEFRVPEQQ